MCGACQSFAIASRAWSAALEEQPDEDSDVSQGGLRTRERSASAWLSALRRSANSSACQEEALRHRLPQVPRGGMLAYTPVVAVGLGKQWAFELAWPS